MDIDITTKAAAGEIVDDGELGQIADTLSKNGVALNVIGVGFDSDGTTSTISITSYCRNMNIHAGQTEMQIANADHWETIAERCGGFVASAASAVV